MIRGKIFIIAAALCLAGLAQAQTFPSRTITLVVPYSPGGGTDAMARLVGQKLSADLRVPVIVDNKPGASGNIGTGFVARAAADGYTLLFTSSGFTINPSLFKHLPFDPGKDFAPIVQLASGPNVLVVNKASGIDSVQELVQRGRTGKALTFGSAGLGQPTHLVAEKFASAAKIHVLHIPYKGSGAAEVALASGDIDFLIDSIPAALPFINAGKTRALGVTGTARFPIAALRNIPTLDESGLKGFSFLTWWGILAPHGIAPDRVAVLSKAVTKAMGSKELQQRFLDIGATPDIKGPPEFSHYIGREMRAYGALIKTLHIAPQ